MQERRLHGLFLLALVGLVVAIVMASYGFPNIVRRQIQKNIQIDNTSAAYDKWQKLPFPLHFNVYLFNVTNAEEVTQGARPKLLQMGPYCYDQYREKTVIGYGENDTIKYMLKKSFVFNKGRSGGLTEDDQITIINLSYMALLLKVDEMMPAMVSMVNDAMELFYPRLDDPFLRTRVGDILFDGVFLNCTADNTALKLVCSRLRQQTPATMRRSKSGDGFYFSMFSHLNQSDPGPYEVVRGTGDIHDLGHIVSYKETRSMDMWRDPYCAMLNGSDSSVFPPINPSDVPDRIYTFEPQICRSMYASLIGQTSAFNMTAYRYEIDRLALASKSAVPGNKCFCQRNWSAKHDGCLVMGVLDLSPCQQVPVIASLPHFYLASEELLEYVDGLAPQRDLHNTYVLLEPTTGVVLKGVRRLQFNVELRQMSAVPQLGNVSTGLFPMLWIEEGAEVPADIVALLRRSGVTLRYVEGARWALLAAALLLAAWSGACVVRRHGLRRSNRSVSFAMSPNGLERKP